MSEADEVADNMSTPRHLTFNEALRIIKEQIPDESMTVQSNVAYALMLKSKLNLPGES